MKLDTEGSENQKPNIGYGDLIRFMAPYLRRHWGLVILLVTLVISLAALSRAVPFLIGEVAERGFRQHDAAFLGLAAFIYLGLELTRSFFEFGQFSLFSFLGNRIIHEVRVDLFKHTQKLPVEFYNQNSTGRILTRLTNDPNTLAELFTDGIVTAFVQSVVLLSIFISMMLISVKLTFISLALAPVLTYVAYQITERIKTILADQKKKLSEINGFLAENFNGIRVIQLMNHQRQARRQLHQLSDEYWKLSMRSVKSYALMVPSMNMLNASVVISSLYMAGSAAIEGKIALASLIAFILNSQDITHPLREILEKYQQFQNSLTSTDRMQTLFSQSEEDFDELKEVSTRFAGHIQFKDLSFQYRPELPFVLNNLNLEVKPGTSLAIAGRTGSGKTTLISLLLRFYEVSKGQMILDGQDIRNLSKLDLRRRFALIQQDPFLFKGSLEDNISLGDESVTPERLERAFKSVGFDRYLEKTGRSLSFQVSEKGSNLSLGERQLIAFLRVLARDPDVVILDEATANVDSETEGLIQRATLEIMKSKTCLIIAHRLSTIENCDQMIILSQGQIQECGRPRDLLRKPSVQNEIEDSLSNS
jgi:ATP-binding cassette subfamily B multidrug efflux pump